MSIPTRIAALRRMQRVASRPSSGKVISSDLTIAGVTESAEALYVANGAGGYVARAGGGMGTILGSTGVDPVDGGLDPNGFPSTQYAGGGLTTAKFSGCDDTSTGEMGSTRVMAFFLTCELPANVSSGSIRAMCGKGISGSDRIQIDVLSNVFRLYLQDGGIFGTESVAVTGLSSTWVSVFGVVDIGAASAPDASRLYLNGSTASTLRSGNFLNLSSINTSTRRLAIGGLQSGGLAPADCKVSNFGMWFRNSAWGGVSDWAAAAAGKHAEWAS